MGLKEWIIPQDRVFYDALESAAANAEACANALHALFLDYQGLADKRQLIKDIEHKGDKITHGIFDHLSTTFITPMDREDISGLAMALDDIVDFMYGAANRLYLYEIQKPTPAMVQFAEILQKQTRELRSAIGEIRSSRTLRAAMKHGIEVNRLENDADRLLNETVAGLFRGSDPINILKHKEIYEMLETATDKCEDAADVIADVVRKQG